MNICFPYQSLIFAGNAINAAVIIWVLCGFSEVINSLEFRFEAAYLERELLLVNLNQLRKTSEPAVKSLKTALPNFLACHDS